MEKIVKNGLRDCTVILDGSECAVRFDTCFRAFSVRNDGAADVFISKTSGIVPDGDGVMCVKSGGSAVFAHNDLDKNTVYLLGTGKVQVHGQQDSNNPFNFAPTFDGGVMASGNPVIMDNLQGGVPFSEMVVTGKNLIPFPYYDGMSKTHNGIIYTVNSDGSVTANGTATDVSYFYIAQYAKIVKNGDTYAISGSPEGSNVDTYRIFINERKSDGTSNGVFIADFNDNKSFTVTDSCNSIHIAIQIRSGVTVDNIVFHPQLELGSTPTAYEPPITGRDLTVNVSGKNLFGDVMNYYLAGNQHDGFVFSPSAGHSFCFLGIIKNNTDYTVTNYSDGNRFKIVLFKNYPDNAAPEECLYILNTESNTVTFNSGEYNYCVLSVAFNDENITIKKAQLEIGIVATTYETYHGSTTTITPDNNPYVVLNDIRQQDGLNNISVSNGKISVVGVRKNAAIKRIWDEIDEIKTAIIVSNGESE